MPWHLPIVVLAWLLTPREHSPLRHVLPVLAALWFPVPKLRLTRGCLERIFR